MAEIPRREKATVLFVATVGSLIFEKDSQLLVRNSFRGKPWKKSYAAGHRTMFFPPLSFFLSSFRSFFQSAKKTARVFSNSRRPKRFDLKCVNSARQAGAQSIRATGINAADFRFAKNFRATPFRLCLDSRSTSSWIDFGEREKVIKSRVGWIF